MRAKAAFLLLALLVAGCGSGHHVPTTSASQPTQSPAASPTNPTSAPSTLAADGVTVLYPSGLTVANGDDVARAGWDPDTTAFLTWELQRQRENQSKPVTITVLSYRTDGWVGGHVEGVPWLWTNQHGGWHTFWRGTELPECAMLRTLGVPSAVLPPPGQCLEAGKPIPYGG